MFVLRAAEAVAADSGSLGVVLGGSGNGELAALAREHNDAQVVSIGARFTSAEEAAKIVDTFLATEFSDEARHRRRVGMVSAYESERILPALPDTTD